MELGWDDNMELGIQDGTELGWDDGIKQGVNTVIACSADDGIFFLNKKWHLHGVRWLQQATRKKWRISSLRHFLRVVMFQFSVRTYVYKSGRFSMAMYVHSKSWTPSWINDLYWYSIGHIQLKLIFSSWLTRVPRYVSSVPCYFSPYFVDCWGTKSTPSTGKLNAELNRIRHLFNNSTFFM